MGQTKNRFKKKYDPIIRRPDNESRKGSRHRAGPNNKTPIYDFLFQNALKLDYKKKTISRPLECYVLLE